MQFLIEFDYDHYCQGYEKANETLLVRADSFDEACRKIAANYYRARNFRNKTVGTLR